MSTIRPQNNKGFGQLLLYIYAGILILFVVNDALSGIGSTLSNVPWYGQIFLCIGFYFHENFGK